MVERENFIGIRLRGLVNNLSQTLGEIVRDDANGEMAGELTTSPEFRFNYYYPPPPSYRICLLRGAIKTPPQRAANKYKLKLFEERPRPHQMHLPLGMQRRAA